MNVASVKNIATLLGVASIPTSIVLGGIGSGTPELQRELLGGEQLSERGSKQFTMAAAAIGFSGPILGATALLVPSRLSTAYRAFATGSIGTAGMLVGASLVTAGLIHAFGGGKPSEPANVSSYNAPPDSPPLSSPAGRYFDSLRERQSLKAATVLDQTDLSGHVQSKIGLNAPDMAHAADASSAPLTDAAAAFDLLTSLPTLSKADVEAMDPQTRQGFLEYAHDLQRVAGND